MITLTTDQICQVMPVAKPARVAEFVTALNQGLHDYGVDTKPDVAAFLATIAEESGEFHFLREIWGPTAQQKKYEPPSSVAKMLGNTAIGDGKRFLGRGLIMTTGRANTERMGKMLGLDLIAKPELLEKPIYAAISACAFWFDKRISEHGDRSDFRKVTRVVNGGLTNIEKREAYYVRARAVLGI